MESLKTLHELKEWWKNVNKSYDENTTVPLRNVSRVTKSEGGNDDTGMFTNSSGIPELEKILELKMMENSGCRVSSVGTEFNEQARKSLSGKGKRMRVWDGEKCAKRFSWETCSVLVSEPSRVEQGIPGCASLIQELVQEDSRDHARAYEIWRAMQLEEDRWNNEGGIKQVWMMFDGKSRQWDIGVDEQGRELKERWEKENGMAFGEVRLMAEGRMIKFGGWDYCAGFGKYLWWNGEEVQEVEGEESMGIGWVGSSILGSRSSLVRWQFS